MALLLSLLMTLVALSCGPAGSLSCVLSRNHVLVSRRNLELMGKMKKVSPFSCLKDRRDFRFPWKMVADSQLQETQAMSVLQEMLQQYFQLFLIEGSSAPWNLTFLEPLRSGLYQQLEDLDSCLVQKRAEESSASGIWGPILAMKKYFWGIHLYLREKKYSDCAWEVVRVEIMRSFWLSTTLQTRLSIKNEDLESP
ncbi:interferon omega-1-like [Suncus etruscus]|uniref:interferon omega-1-like n=1 Tax=Suncus etruscus TaxID=109475 RepID=UPI00210F820C|nr:interferon omega-1-like [Suncus etruscus]